LIMHLSHTHSVTTESDSYPGRRRKHAIIVQVPNPGGLLTMLYKDKA
jgi:hypothetical protein